MFWPNQSKVRPSHAVELAPVRNGPIECRTRGKIRIGRRQPEIDCRGTGCLRAGMDQLKRALKADHLAADPARRFGTSHNLILWHTQAT